MGALVKEVPVFGAEIENAWLCWGIYIVGIGRPLAVLCSCTVSCPCQVGGVGPTRTASSSSGAESRRMSLSSSSARGARRDW